MLALMAQRIFSFLGYHKRHDGYGYAFIKTAEAMRRIAIGQPPVAIIPVENPADGPTPKRRVEGTAVALLSPPWFPFIKADYFIGYTMFESTQLPPDFLSIINKRCQMVIVPALWNAEVFRANGVTAPLHVVPFGIDPQDYFPLERKRTEGTPYRFAWSGTPDMRKGWDVVYRAFSLAFGQRTDVRLRLHFRSLPTSGVTFRDANVEVTHGPLEMDAMRDFYQQADCFLFPSRGEGWGLPPREAAATGLPVIATNYGGLADELANWGVALNVSHMRPADYGVWPVGTVGEWAEPDVDHLVALMREAVERPAEWAARGARAAHWLAEKTPWERTARGVMAIANLSGGANAR